MFMDNEWLFEPALETFQNIAACRNKASQTREHVLFVILTIVMIIDKLYRKLLFIFMASLPYFVCLMIEMVPLLGNH